MTRPTVSPIASAIMRLWSDHAPEVSHIGLVVSASSWRVVPLRDSATIRDSTPGERHSMAPLPHGAPRRKTAKHVARNMLRKLRPAP